MVNMYIEEVFLYDRGWLASGADHGRPPPPVEADPDVRNGLVYDDRLVRLPCFGYPGWPDCDRWEHICRALRADHQCIGDWCRAIRAYTGRPAADFELLQALFDQQLAPQDAQLHLRRTLPAMAALARRLPELLPVSLPRLAQRASRCVHLSQQQAACLLANAFFCTFTNDEPTSSNHQINFQQ